MRKKPHTFGPFTTLVIKLDRDRAFRERYKKDPVRIIAQFEKSHHHRVPPRLLALVNPRSRKRLSDDKINRAIDAEWREHHRPRRRPHGGPVGGPTPNPGGTTGGNPPPLTHVGLASQLQGNG